MPFPMDMLSPASAPGVPQGYIPPDQISQMYDYAGNLTKGGQRDAPISSPWQGARMMADALAGRSMRNQAGGAQAGNTFGAGAQIAQTQGAGAPPSPPPPGSPPPMQGTPAPPSSIHPQPQMGGGSPVQGLGGSVPSGMPGGMPGGPGGMMGGMQPPPFSSMAGMGGQPPNPMMQALMSQPPGQGMS